MSSPIIFKDDMGNEWEAVHKGKWYTYDAEQLCIKPVKKPKWSVEWHEAGVLVKIPDDSIKVNEKIKAFIEASLGFIHGDDEYSNGELYYLADKAREAIGDKDE